MAAALIAAAALGAALLFPVSASADTNPYVAYSRSMTPGAIHEIRASYSWKCLDVRGASNKQGTAIQTFDCKGKLHQRFLFVGHSEHFNILTWAGCLGTGGGNRTAGAGVVQTQGSECLTFRWADRANNHWEIVEEYSGLCLRDTGRANQVVLGACGVTGEPYPSLWRPIYDRMWNFNSVNG